MSWVTTLSLLANCHPKFALQNPAQSSGEDARRTPVPRSAVESGHGGSEEDGTEEQTKSAVYGVGVDERNIVKGKWRKAGDRDGMRSDYSKRRRSSGWFKRLASSFQTNRPRSASEELREHLPSPLPELADNENSGGDDEGQRRLGSTAPLAASSRGRSLFGGDSAWKEKAPPPNGRGIELEEWTSAASSRTEASDISRERSARWAAGGGDTVVIRADGAGMAAETEDDSDYETGSNTTEGFGSDDAGDLWDGRRSTLMGPLGRTSFMPIDNGMRGETVQAGEGASVGIGANGEGKGGDGANPPSAREEKVGGRDTTRGARLGEVGAGEVEALIDLEKSTEGAITVPAFHGSTNVSTAAGVETDSVLNVPDSVKRSDGDHHVEKECKEDQEARGTTGSAAAGAKAADINSPVPTPRSCYFANVSPSPAPPSVLPASPEPESKGEGKESPLPPVVVEQQTPSPFSKFGSSPAISDGSSCKESPRAWRLSWWARASDRHPPPPPSGNADNEEAGGTTGTSFAAALAAASAGGEEAASALSAGGAFAPSFNAGDAPAVVDGGDRTPSPEEAQGSGGVGATTGAGVERREKRRLNRRRREKPWLSKDKLADTQARPLEAASEYLDVVGLARSGLVCRPWKKTLSAEEGRKRWMSCVRLADGVPDKWRAKFYLHILYDQPSWVEKVCGGIRKALHILSRAAFTGLRNRERFWHHSWQMRVCGFEAECEVHCFMRDRTGTILYRLFLASC